MRGNLIRAFIGMVCIKCRCTFDNAEYECLIVLMTFLTSMELTPDVGIETNINRFYMKPSSLTKIGIL